MPEEKVSSYGIIKGEPTDDARTMRVLADRQPVYAYDFEGTRYDLGDKLGFLKATVEFALRREGLGEGFSGVPDRVGAADLMTYKPLDLIHRFALPPSRAWGRLFVCGAWLTVRVCESNEIHGLDGRVRAGAAISGVAGALFLL